MPTWVDISNAEIAVDADVETTTFLRLKQRGDFFKEVIDGINADKIPGQAIRLQASSSGSGLTVDRHNYKTDGIGSPVTLSAGSGTVYAQTNIPASQNWATMIGLEAGTLTAGVIVVNLSLDVAASSNYRIRFDYTGSSGGTIEWRMVAIAV